MSIIVYDDRYSIKLKHKTVNRDIFVLLIAQTGCELEWPMSRLIVPVFNLITCGECVNL